jgi:hypothetical protein
MKKGLSQERQASKYPVSANLLVHGYLLTIVRILSYATTNNLQFFSSCLVFYCFAYIMAAKLSIIF